MIGEKINATGMTGFVREERTRSQWGQWRREKSAYMLKCPVHKCMREAGRIFVFKLMHLCVSGCIHHWGTVPLPGAPRLRGQNGWWSHHVVGKIFQPSHREYGEQRDDGDVPRDGWDDRNTLETACKRGYRRKKNHTNCTYHTHTQCASTSNNNNYTANLD